MRNTQLLSIPSTLFAGAAAVMLLGSPAQAAGDAKASSEKSSKSADSASKPTSVLPNWSLYQQAHELKCLAPFEKIERPETADVGGVTLELHGYKAVLKPKAKKGKGKSSPVRLGVVSAIKDHSAGTAANLEKFVKWFKEQKADAIVVNGDVAYEESEIRSNLETLAKSGLPVLTTIGNSETVAAFNAAVKALRDDYPNLVNLNLVRLVELGGASVVSLPGYFNRVFIHAAGGCHYRDEDVDELAVLLKEASGPVVLVSHGPPKGEGKESIDYAVEAGNVGNAKLTQFLKKKDVRFGIFGHILEAGGRAVAGDIKTVVPTEKWTDALFINAGSASSTPWQMNDGTVSAGMAVVLEVDGKKRGRYLVKKFSH